MPLEDLLEVLKDIKDIEISFSANCVSGLIGRETCQCWRCRGIDPLEELSGWGRASMLISRGFCEEQRNRRRVKATATKQRGGEG